MKHVKNFCYFIAVGLFSWSTVGIANADDRKADQAQAAPGEVMAAEVHAVATVDKIDAKNRELTLRDTHGNRFKLSVPESVTNFDEIKKGDRLAIDYFTSVALALKPNDPAKPAVHVSERVAGPLPNGLAAHEVKLTAEVVKVDTAANTMTIKAPGGELDTIQVTDPEMQADLAKLKKGDKIEASYNEAVAITIAEKKS